MSSTKRLALLIDTKEVHEREAGAKGFDTERADAVRTRASDKPGQRKDERTRGTGSEG